MEPMAVPRRLSEVARRWLAILAAMGVVAVGILAGAQPAGAATVVDVEAGYGGSFRSGAPVPVRVRVAADRLVRGELEVRASSNFGDAARVAVPVEAAGGTVKEVLVTVPTDAGGPRVDVVAVLRVGGDEVARGQASIQVSVDTELVGLLAGALAGREPPGPAPLAIDAGTARFNALGPVELAAAPASLAALDVVGAAPDDLAALDDTTRAAVLAWVGEGGTLLVDVAPGEAVTGLPADWQPGRHGRAVAGLGEIRATDGAMAAGNWSGLVEPTPMAVTGGEFFGGFGIDSSLAADAGLRAPQLGWLVGFLVVYVLVAVPLTLTLLRRRGRGEWGWVALPVLALVFTGASYGAGRAARSGATAAHATVVHVTDAGAVATTSVGIVSPDGGQVEVDYPRRWTLSGRSQYRDGPPVETLAAIGSDGVRVSQQLDVGQFGVQRVSGPMALEGALEISAVVAGDTTLEGRVRNTLSVALEEVAVLHDDAAARIGRLEPGEERAWTLAVGGNTEPFPGPAAEAWPEASGFNRPPDPDSMVAFSVWTDFQASAATDLLAPGTVVAAGWTRELAPPLDIPGSSVSGRTLVVATGPVDRRSDDLAGPSVQTSVVRGPFANGGFVDQNTPAVFRLVLPSFEDQPIIDPGRLLVRGPQRLGLDAWVDDAWLALSEGTLPDGAGRGGAVLGPGGGVVERPGDMGPAVGLALPPAAVDGGVVWVRARGGQVGFIDPFTLANTTLVTLESAP